MSTLASIGTSAPSRPAGAWRLSPGQAMTLKPSQAGVLWVAAGGLWATGDGPHVGPANGRGDRVLAAGEALRVRAGEQLVVEAVGPAPVAQFGWDPLPPWPARRRSLPALLWRAVLLLPATALTAAMWLGAAAESGRHRADVAAAPVAPATLQAHRAESSMERLRQHSRARAPA